MNSAESIIEAENDSKVKNGPYWIIDLLFNINKDCMSYVIELLAKNHREEVTIKSFLNLVFGIRKYVTMIEAIDPYTTNLTEQGMVHEYREYTISLKNIIKKIKEDLARVDIMTSLPPDLQTHIERVIEDLEVSHQFSKKKSLKQAEVPKKVEKPSPLKDQSQMYQSVPKVFKGINEREFGSIPKPNDFSFRGSESSSNRSSDPRSKKKFEEEKDQKLDCDKSDDSESSDGGFKRKTSSQRSNLPQRRVQQPQILGVPKRF